ncbi:hypothetical protein [Streptomyces rubiginosohelvolus]|uniref:hypothetical protein n=1 Tax=Streptomyces rubiginosohelvolus TaxID=67362 RepID=UPI00386D0F21|nr:hypothetical protein OG475_34615 [Streptomyces rubiginosohelvolus]
MGGWAMGRASRNRREGRRKKARGWDPAVAARDALRDQKATIRLLENNSYAAAYFAAATDRVFQEAMWQHIRLGSAPAQAWHETAAWMMGAAGFPRPWPHNIQFLADYAVFEREQQLALLRDGEVCVISPDAHATVMAAALTLDADDLLTLDQDTDIPMRAALVVMPEPVVLSRRDVVVGDFSVFGWRRSTMYGSAGQEHAAVGVSAMFRPDGPVQSPDWTDFVAEAQANGYPAPPWFPSGSIGMRADSSTRSALAHTEAIEEIRARHMLLRDVADLLRADDALWAPESAQWNGEPVADPHHDFPARYLFAFWRLAAQGITVTATPPDLEDDHQPSPGSAASVQGSSGIRLVDLRRPTERPSGTAAASSPRHYTHRWPVKMHKVNQWYPSLGRHQIRWRGPYIQGPAGTPLRVRETAYHLS